MGGFVLPGKIEFLPYVKVFDAKPPNGRIRMNRENRVLALCKGAQCETAQMSISPRQRRASRSRVKGGIEKDFRFVGFG